MIYPLVAELADDGIPVAVTCRVLGIARQPYYRWLAVPVTASALEEAYLANAIFDAHRDDPEFGYRFLADEIRDAGFTVADRTVLRICSDNGWWSVFGKKTRGKNGKAGPPVHDDLVRRDFTADAPNQLWLADITEHPTAEGKLYLCAIKDVFSNRIVGYSIDSRMKSRLAVAALDQALARRRQTGGEVAGCILHTDRGSQFRSRKFVRALHRHGLVGSMGRVGAAGDNAAMESFFALLQKNVLNWRRQIALGADMQTQVEKLYVAQLKLKLASKKPDAPGRTVNRLFNSLQMFRRSFAASAEDWTGRVALSTAFEMLLTDHYGSVKATLVNRSKELMRGQRGTRGMQQAIGDLYGSRSELVHGAEQTTSADMLLARRAYAICFLEPSKRLGQIPTTTSTPVGDVVDR